MKVQSLFVTPSEAAGYLGVSTITIYTWIRKKLIPFIRPGRSIYIPRQAVDELMQGRKFNLHVAKSIEVVYSSEHDHM